MSATMLSAWEATLRAAPDAVAIVDVASGNAFTRAELDVPADAWCAKHGSDLKGRSVVFAEPNGPGWFTLFIGLLKADAVIIPLDAGEPVAAQIAMATALRAAYIWTGGELRAVAARQARRRDGRRVIKLTSGSTGTPRPLAFTDAQMLADGRQVCAGMDIRSSDVNFGLIPFGHSYGLGNLVVPFLAQGTGIVCGAAALPHAMAEAIARWRPTVFPSVPALLNALATADVEPSKLESLRTVISAGAPLAPEIAEKFRVKFGREIHSFYGSSETGGITYDETGDAARTGRSVGKPLPGVRLTFGRGQRFTVESAAVFTLGNRRLEPERHGRHRPADLGILTADGDLVLLGRVGRFVKIAGRRLNLVEVERALKQVSGVRDAWVTPHPARADALAAALVTNLSSEEVRSVVRERLAGWKIPKKIVTLETFPLTRRGKTDTARLAELVGDTNANPAEQR
jgi:long-chain acyl-CoA synthetase